MVWKKEGIIFVPNNNWQWMTTHAQVPTALVIEDRLTVFFATRNTLGQSHIAKIDLDATDPKKIIELHKEPLLSPGKPGTFDEDGVMPSCVLRNKDEIWLYYTGWNKKVSTPYHNSIGLAISKDNGKTFTRLYEGPILDRTIHEPYIVITPYVIAEQNIFKMWYASGINWIKNENKYEPVYVIKYATSIDGIIWKRSGTTCITPRHEQEALCTPTVIVENGCYKMWFSYRDSNHFRDGKGSYRIGYASSNDGISWERKDNQSGIDVSKAEWDSTMICYPNVFKYNKLLYMLYNGNGFGHSGFGFAVQSSSKN